MIKIEIASEIAKTTGLTVPQSQVAIDAFMETVKKALSSGDAVYLRGFGTFSAKKRAEKVARNIRKETSIVVPEHLVPHFKPSDDFKALLR